MNVAYVELNAMCKHFLKLTIELITNFDVFTTLKEILHIRSQIFIARNNNVNYYYKQ